MYLMVELLFDRPMGQKSCVRGMIREKEPKVVQPVPREIVTKGQDGNDFMLHCRRKVISGYVVRKLLFMVSPV